MRPTSRLLAVLLSLAMAGCGGGGSLVDGLPAGGGGGGGGGTPPPATSDQQFNLDRLNAFRSQLGAPPLVLDAQLNAFALAGSQQLSVDHTPHKHFSDACNAGTMFTTDGFQGSAGENQGDPNGWPAATNVAAQIDQILTAMWNEGPGSGASHGHYNNMVNPAFHRVGVGLLLDPNGKLYFTNDFSQ